MNEPRTTIPGLPFSPDPPKDRYGRPLPPATVELLIQVQILLVYARHLLAMLRQAGERGIALIARCFGATQAGFVLTHLSRGILRAIALQRVLLALAGSGQPEPAARQPRKRTASAAPRSGRRPPHPFHGQLPGLPTLRQLEAAIRRRPLAFAIDDISHDFGVSISLCDARFGNALRDMAAAYRDTIRNVLHEITPRELAFANAPEPTSAFALPPRIPDAIRYIVGCLGAQQPVCGFSFTASPAGAATAGAQPP